MENIKLPKITVITPSFNQGKFIERTIESVLGQGYPHLEYLVMDGGSRDETVPILKKYEGRLRWVSEKDRGQSDAINKGIRAATGDVIAYLNSDDVYEPGALEKVGRLFAANPIAMWAAGRCRIIDVNGKEVRGAIMGYKNFLLSRYSYNILLVTNFISQPATFLRKEVFKSAGLFDEGQHRVMDYEYWLRIGKKWPPVIINDYLAGFRVHYESKTSSGFTETFRQELDVSRKYSRSKALNALHYLNYIGICAAYTALDALASRKRAR